MDMHRHARTCVDRHCGIDGCFMFRVASAVTRDTVRRGVERAVRKKQKKHRRENRGKEKPTDLQLGERRDEAVVRLDVLKLAPVHVSIQMPMHISVHVSTHMCISLPLRMSAQMQIHVSMDADTNVCTHVYTHMFMHMSIRMPTQTSIHVCMCMRKRMCTHMSINMSVLNDADLRHDVPPVADQSVRAPDAQRDALHARVRASVNVHAAGVHAYLRMHDRRVSACVPASTGASAHARAVSGLTLG